MKKPKPRRPPRQRQAQRQTAAADTNTARKPDLPGWLAPVLTAVLVATLGWFAKDVINRDAVTDRVRGVVPGGYGAEMEYEVLNYDADGGTVAIPAGATMSPALQQYLSSRTPVDGSQLADDEKRKLREELETIGADPAAHSAALILKSQRRQGIRITNIVPVEVRRSPVYDGALALLPSQGPEESVTMVLNFDEPSPRPRAVKDNDPTKIQGFFFPGTTITLSDGKQEAPLVIHSVITKGSVSFKIRVDFLVGNDARTLTVDNRGQPFRLTGYNCTGAHQASYRQAVHATGAYIEPVDNPQRMRLDDCQ